MKKKQVEIACGEGQQAYGITLTVEDLNVFERASKNPDVIGKEGEAFIKAIMATVDQGNVSEIMRHRDDKRVDGANGEAAYETRCYIEHRNQDGKLCDGAKGEAARQNFDLFGILWRAEHYNQDGKRHDGTNGEAARKAFNGGVGFGLLQRRKEIHYDNGRKLKRREVNERAAQNIKAANPSLKIR